MSNSVKSDEQYILGTQISCANIKAIFEITSSKSIIIYKWSRAMNNSLKDNEPRTIRKWISHVNMKTKFRINSSKSIVMNKWSIKQLQQSQR